MTGDPAPPMRPGQSAVIVGAGLAGLRVAEALREAGFAGRVILIGDEPHPPYDRPPLSKSVLEAKSAEDRIALSPEGALDSIEVELRLGHPVTLIDRARREVEIEGGERLSYDRLVLATGSCVRTLDLLPLGMPRVHYLRGLDDARRLREALAGRPRLAVVGGGVIGLEVAATARGLGCGVTVIEAADRLMGRAASPTISDYMRRRHAAEGVKLRLGAAVADARADGGAIALTLSSGERLAADRVVVGVGVTPRANLAAACGLALSDGAILVDERGRTSDEAIYAAGEVAAHYNDAFGRHDRQETWNHAAQHGAHVGRALMGDPSAYRLIPSYWSDQYDINLMIEGAPAGDADVVRGDVDGGRFLVFHLAGGRVVGVSAVNAARELRAARRLIGRSADAAALADGAVGLAQLAAA